MRKKMKKLMNLIKELSKIFNVDRRYGYNNILIEIERFEGTDICSLFYKEKWIGTTVFPKKYLKNKYIFLEVIRGILKDRYKKDFGDKEILNILNIPKDVDDIFVSWKTALKEKS
jgi:hypothetical protein